MNSDTYYFSFLVEKMGVGHYFRLRYTCLKIILLKKTIGKIKVSPGMQRLFAILHGTAMFRRVFLLY